MNNQHILIIIQYLLRTSNVENLMLNLLEWQFSSSQMNQRCHLSKQYALKQKKFSNSKPVESVRFFGYSIFKYAIVADPKNVEKN